MCLELDEVHANFTFIHQSQALDNALAAAQMLDDPRDMIARSYQLLERVSKG